MITKPLQLPLPFMPTDPVFDLTMALEDLIAHADEYLKGKEKEEINNNLLRLSDSVAQARSTLRQLRRQLRSQSK